MPSGWATYFVIIIRWATKSFNVFFKYIEDDIQ